MNHEESKHEGVRDVAHYKKVSNCHASGQGMAATVGAPRIVLRDIIKSGYIVSDDNSFWYKMQTGSFKSSRVK